MQMQPKIVKTSQNRSLTPRVGSKSQKDDFDYTRSNHQTNTHQDMMDVHQNEDIAVKSSIETPSLMDFQQQTAFSELDLSSYERVQDQIESTLNSILGKDKYFKFNSPDHLKSILIDRTYARSGLMSQILELKAFQPLQGLDLSRKLLKTQQEFSLLSQNYSLQQSELLNLAENPRRGSSIKPITKDLNLKNPHRLNLCNFQVDDLRAEFSLVNESWNYLEELKLCPYSLPERFEDRGYGSRQCMGSL